MPGVISSIRNMFTSDSSAKLQAAQQEAGAVIQKLRENGDTDVTAILVARYEELKERQEQLTQFQASWQLDPLEKNLPEHPTEHTPEEQDISSLQIKIVTQDDGSLKCIRLPSPHNPTEESLESVMKPSHHGECHEVENIMAAAEQLITLAMETIEKHSQTLQYFQILYLSDMSDRLEADEEKIESLKTHVSSTATELAAHLYFSDARRFLQTALLMVGQIVGDEEAEKDGNQDTA